MEIVTWIESWVRPQRKQVTDRVTEIGVCCLGGHVGSAGGVSRSRGFGRLPHGASRHRAVLPHTALRHPSSRGMRTPVADRSAQSGEPSASMTAVRCGSSSSWPSCGSRMCSSQVSSKSTTRTPSGVVDSVRIARSSLIGHRLPAHSTPNSTKPGAERRRTADDASQGAHRSWGSNAARPGSRPR